MARIIYFISSLENKSPNNVLYNIISNFDDKEKVYIVTISSEKKDSLLSKFKELGVNIKCLKLGFFNSFFLSNKKFGKLVDEVNPGIIQSQGFRPDLILSLFKTKSRFKKVTLVHNVFLLDYKMTYGFLLGYFMTLVNNLILKRFDYVVGVSNSVFNNLMRPSLKDKLLYIQNGVDRKKYFDISLNLKKEKRLLLELPIDKKIWIVVGSLSHRKNPFQIIRVFKEFNKDFNNILLFLGDGELFGQIEVQIKNEKGIYLIGNVDNVANYLQCSDYFISSSKSEGLPMAVLEALSSGLPVILSDIPSHKEIFSKNPNIGYMFNLDSDLDFLHGLRLMSNSNLVQISAECKLLVDSYFSSEIMAGKYLNFYKQILK